MSLFKVVPYERTKKVAIKAATVQEVIDKATVKLGLAHGTYQVALEEDGTEVDEDDILLDIAKTAHTAVTLMLVPEGLSWKDRSSVQTIDSSSRTTEATVHSNVEPSVSTSSVPERFQMDCGSSLWQRFPVRLLRTCERDEPVRSDDRRAMVAVVADYMLQDLNDSSRKTTERIARMIFDKYPKSFTDTINDEVLGTGMESLRSQIYTAVHYRKDSRSDKKRCVEVGSDESDSETSSVSSVSRKQDEYGCVEYQPLLPPTESKAAQEEKRLLLIQYHTSRRTADEEVMKLNDETYVSQRLSINRKDRAIQKVLEDWPFLANSNVLIKHGSRLLGKSVLEVWEKSLSDKAEPIRKYFKSVEIARTHKNRKAARKAGAEGDGSPPEENYTLKMLREAKEQALNITKSAIPQLAVVFPLIIHYMKEEESLLFLVVDEDLSDDAVQAQITNMNPILIIRGQSMYDENARYNVVLEKKTWITTGSLLTGLLVTFLAYYIFGYAYPLKLSSTLEFIQRVFLGINPAKGDKRDTKKRRTLPYDARVLKLTKELNAFTNAF